MKILALLLSALVLAQTVNVVVILHNHQPWYIDLERGELVLPWVRMHAVGNYLKVPLLINQTGVSVAFTLSGSLIEQLNWYANGTYLDARFKISEKLARGLDGGGEVLHVKSARGLLRHQLAEYPLQESALHRAPGD